MKIAQKLLLSFLLLPPSILGMEPEAAHALENWPVPLQQSLSANYLGSLPAELRLELLNFACGPDTGQAVSFWAQRIEQNLLPVIKNMPEQDIILNFTGSTYCRPPVACNPQGTLIAIAPAPSQLYLWDAQKGNLVTKPDIKGDISALGFTQTGDFLVVVSRPGIADLTWPLSRSIPKVSFYNMTTGTWAPHFFNGFHELLRDGKELVYAIKDQENIHLIDPTTATKRKSLSSDYFYNINADGSLIAIANRDQTVTIYGLKNGVKKSIARSVVTSIDTTFVRFIDNRTFLTFSASTKKIFQWNISNGRLLEEYPLETADSKSTDFWNISPSGKYIIGNFSSEICVWNARSGALLYSKKTSEGIVTKFHCADDFFVAYYKNKMDERTTKWDYSIIESSTGKRVAQIEIITPDYFDPLYLEHPTAIIIINHHGLLLCDLNSWDPKTNNIDLYRQHSKHATSIDLVQYLAPLGCILTKACGTIRLWKNHQSWVENCLIQKTTPYQILFLIDAHRAAIKRLPLTIMNNPNYQEAFNQFPPAIQQTIRTTIELITNQQELDAYWARFPQPLIGSRLPELKPAPAPQPTQDPNTTSLATKRKHEGPPG